MRLWHIDLIQYLPTSQLKAQWSELNSIFKKQDNHILINYIYDYPKEFLFDYTCAVNNEMIKRKINIRNFENYANYFNDLDMFEFMSDNEFKEHNDQYLLICFMNLYEKYIRGQKDFTKECFNRLYDFVNTKFDLKSLGIEKGE